MYVHGTTVIDATKQNVVVLLIYSKDSIILGGSCSFPRGPEASTWMMLTVDQI